MVGFKWLLVLASVFCSFVYAKDLRYSGEEYSGGETTSFDFSRTAFSRPVRNVDEKNERAFFVGNALFKEPWVTAPASTPGRDGLGPIFNAVSCSSCHFNDGRGRPPRKGEEMLSILFRLSVKGPNGEDQPHPVYGGQLQNRGVEGVPPEGNVRFDYRELKRKYADGSEYTLIEPTYTFVQLSHGPLGKNVRYSPRVAPTVVGLGLLEAVSEETILSFADPNDRDGDGISGRPNYVKSIRSGKKELGRFGWKANQPTVEQQNAGAFLGDIGITSELIHDESCTATQTACRQAASGGVPELSSHKLKRVTEYVQLIAPPARRDVDDPSVKRGQELFTQIRCNQCHIPQMRTGESEVFKELSNQIIRPYTDLLLHDMGEALADHRPDGLATGREWRTPPLWGIGLTQVVNGHTRFLHDGRARNLTEAVLWHGGEAERSRQAFEKLSSSNRGHLIRFLESL